tara:strand:+ start:214 stop:501 length:288 start_codon:yes stop_codon:yes gene_type:complete
MKKLKNHIDIRILEKAKLLDMINKYLAKYSNKCTVFYACNLVDNLLILGATDSSSLNSLRNYQRDILKDINFEFKESLKTKLTKIRFKIIQNPEI